MLNDLLLLEYENWWLIVLIGQTSVVIPSVVLAAKLAQWLWPWLLRIIVGMWASNLLMLGLI